MNDITKRIGSIEFACTSPEEIRNMSVLTVISADTYDDEGYPVTKGLMDPRMGVIEPGLRCKTCGCKNDECTGHFGHIELAMPVIHITFIDMIKKLLETHCKHCGMILTTPEVLEEYKSRKKEMADYGTELGAGYFGSDVAKEIKKSRTVQINDDDGEPHDYTVGYMHIESKDLDVVWCPHCHQVNSKVKLDKPTTFRYSNLDFELQPEEIMDKTESGIKKIIDGKLDEKESMEEKIKEEKLTPKQVREWLERILAVEEFDKNGKKRKDSEIEAEKEFRKEALRVMDFNPETLRPEWMVLTVLAVPPVTVRPSITLDLGERSEDDLTHKLIDILKINQKLKESRDTGAPQLIVDDLWGLLQYHVTTYFDNQTSKIPPAMHRSGRSLRTLAQRLYGKEGRFRFNLSGKRVNFSARTVITPDPMLSINEVGVPIEAARELTVPMHVNELNKETMKEIVKRGRSPVDENGKYIPGVNYVIRSDGRRIRLTDENAETVAENLDLDYTVERQLQDGDVVLFNRQPSLHRMSMMAHLVRVMEGHTFRFNLCVCPPYNADFDGDEMNLHVLQGEEARAEARIIMLVQENILSPRYGGPIIGPIHDHITGAYFLTAGNPRFNKMEMMTIMSKLDDVEIPKPYVDENGKEYWTGKQLFSTVLPDDIKIAPFRASICKGCKTCKKEQCKNDAYVVIKEKKVNKDGYVEGGLVCGTIDVKAIGNNKGRILDQIAHDYDADRACKFINDVTRIALGAIMNCGFSTGIDDEDIDENAKMKVESYSQECMNDVDKYIESYRKGELEQMPGRSIRETLEIKAQAKLEEARNEAGNVVAERMGMNNPAVVMSKCGARGSMLNLSQMAACVGQQTVRGDRLMRGYRDRTLSHFEKNDLGALSRGFVKSSYKVGLTPTEFFFHAMGGREGLVDTAVRTSRSGYMQRRLMSALEDLKLTDDGSVRNTEGAIIQFKYGEDGVNPISAVGGDAIDIDNLFLDVLGPEKAIKFLRMDKKDVTKNYGEHEGDDIEAEEGEESEPIESDYEGE